MTLDQTIAACEANEADALNGRIDWPTFKARRETLEAAYQRALTDACIRAAKAYAVSLRSEVA